MINLQADIELPITKFSLPSYTMHNQRHAYFMDKAIALRLSLFLIKRGNFPHEPNM